MACLQQCAGSIESLAWQLADHNRQEGGNCGSNLSASLAGICNTLMEGVIK